MVEISADILMESTSHFEEDIEEARKTMKSFGGKVVVMPYYPAICSTKFFLPSFLQHH